LVRGAAARVASWEFLSGEVLEPHKKNADECFFGTRFNCRVLLMVVRRLDDATRRNTPPNGSKFLHEPLLQSVFSSLRNASHVTTFEATSRWERKIVHA
jgi:hypothetical protein